MGNRAGLYPKHSPQRRWVIYAIAAGWLFWGFGYQTVWQRLAIQLDGTVTSSQDVPSTGAPRYATYYVIHGSDGRDRTYVAGPTDESLARSIPVGAHVSKVWGQLGYEVNGRWIAFPIAFYGAVLTLAAFLAGAAIRGWWRERQTNA